MRSLRTSHNRPAQIVGFIVVKINVRESVRLPLSVRRDSVGQTLYTCGNSIYVRGSLSDESISITNQYAASMAVLQVMNSEQSVIARDLRTVHMKCIVCAAARTDVSSKVARLLHHLTFSKFTLLGDCRVCTGLGRPLSDNILVRWQIT